MLQEMLQETINAAKEIRSEPPRPLMPAVAKPDPFPVDALGDVLGQAGRPIHDRIRAPMAIARNAVLATAALAAQGHADATVTMKSDNGLICPKIGNSTEREDLFTVVSEQFLTAEARYADIVLPATTQLEQFDIMFSCGHLTRSLSSSKPSV